MALTVRDRETHSCPVCVCVFELFLASAWFVSSGHLQMLLLLLVGCTVQRVLSVCDAEAI